MTLWILYCRVNEKRDILYAFYAQDQDDAERQAKKIQKEQGYERKDLKAFPYGFVMHHSRIAGTIEE